MRSSTRARKQPPAPSAKRARPSANWVTLREAETATGIPVNTLRKWVRRADLPSYLESDGDVALRMVDLDAVVARARALGRPIEPLPAPTEVPAAVRTLETPGVPDDEPDDAVVPTAPPGTAPAEGTMIVPIDAWNKMLNQLGNLHEAGQQLAEARERAAKAETEVAFLRERLAELRRREQEGPAPAVDSTPPAPPVGPVETVETVDAAEPPGSPAPPHTTTYWRYLTTGWRDRRRRKGRSH